MGGSTGPATSPSRPRPGQTGDHACGSDLPLRWTRARQVVERVDRFNGLRLLLLEVAVVLNHGWRDTRYLAEHGRRLAGHATQDRDVAQRVLRLDQRLGSCDRSVASCQSGGICPPCWITCDTPPRTGAAASTARCPTSCAPSTTFCAAVPTSLAACPRTGAACWTQTARRLLPARGELLRFGRRLARGERGLPAARRLADLRRLPLLDLTDHALRRRARARSPRRQGHPAPIGWPSDLVPVDNQRRLRRRRRRSTQHGGLLRPLHRGALRPRYTILEVHQQVLRVEVLAETAFRADAVRDAVPDPNVQMRGEGAVLVGIARVADRADLLPSLDRVALLQIGRRVEVGVVVIGASPSRGSVRRCHRTGGHLCPGRPPRPCRSASPPTGVQRRRHQVRAALRVVRRGRRVVRGAPPEGRRVRPRPLDRSARRPGPGSTATEGTASAAAPLPHQACRQPPVPAGGRWS